MITSAAAFLFDELISLDNDLELYKGLGLTEAYDKIKAYAWMLEQEIIRIQSLPSPSTSSSQIKLGIPLPHANQIESPAHKESSHA